MPIIEGRTAEIMNSIVEFASDGTFPQLKRYLTEEHGWTPGDIVRAAEEIGEAAGMDPQFSAEDFGE